MKKYGYRQDQGNHYDFEQSALTSMELEADDLKITLQKDAPVLCRENTASSVQESIKEEAVSAAPNTVSGEAVPFPFGRNVLCGGKRNFETVR